MPTELLIDDTRPLKDPLYVQITHSSFTFSVFLLGSFCNCILPQALKASTVRHDPNSQGYDNEKKRLRSAFSCLSSISMNQKEVSMSSLFLHSHCKGCLPPWELKRSRNRSLKEGWEPCLSHHRFLGQKSIKPRFSATSGRWGMSLSYSTSL